ncbi:diiron oxygenase [Mechercharimyces sp. CAU 1602]|uniref:diiron oxygenase n=1 Tax=Mechercharimyces sp. CAU 1602 TaxID=2973933 RepID=UPI0021612DF6|nr:diiron oxygenase [Mechercharimyces sp. CAU 1602]MCS1351837.1 diiron oxygenase [Mechercharimyces sp. CAU 1602]
MIDHKQNRYKSAFSKWEEESAVRAKPSRFTKENEHGEFFFTPELVPICDHQLVQRRGVQASKRLIIHHLYTHLNFTEHLEHEVVNHITFQIGKEKTGLILPPAMIADAWKIYVDEAYHYKFSAELVSKVISLTGVPLQKGRQPQFLTRLHTLLADETTETRSWLLLFFTIISETLISGTLMTVPQDQRVVPLVREIIKDHAEDEVRHHAYFAALIGHVWSQLSSSLKQKIGPFLPEFIVGFLEPDLTAVDVSLQQERFTKKEREWIIGETYTNERIQTDIQKASKVAVRHLRKHGVLDEPYTQEAFFKKGFLLS